MQRNEPLAIGIGSNLGSRLAQLTSAVEMILDATRPRSHRLAPIYECLPVDGVRGDPFLNSVVVIDSPLETLECFEITARIEIELGRRRPTAHAPRTIDLDLLLRGHQMIRSDHLQIPHPRMHLRPFVLKPLVDLKWSYPHPVLNLTPTQMLARLEPGSLQLSKHQWPAALIG